MNGFVRCACKYCGHEEPWGRQCGIAVDVAKLVVQCNDRGILLQNAVANKHDVCCGDCWEHAHLMFRRGAVSRMQAKRKAQREEDQQSAHDRSRPRSKSAYVSFGDEPDRSNA